MASGPVTCFCGLDLGEPYERLARTRGYELLSVVVGAAHRLYREVSTRVHVHTAECRGGFHNEPVPTPAGRRQMRAAKAEPG